MNIINPIFHRSYLLLGEPMMQNMQSKRIILFGIGGVGSWCAESLIRTGFTNLTIVDSDRVCITNTNRQIHSFPETVGKVKVDIMKQRLLSINPNSEIKAIQKIYNEHSRETFELNTYDYIIDCIDSLSYKIDLIRSACDTNAYFISSLGASLKIDSTRIKVSEFWNVLGCPFGSILRKRIRRGRLPSKPFLCVYSDEVLENRGHSHICGFDSCLCPKNNCTEGDPKLASHEWCSKKSVINGTSAHITAIFGFTLAGLIVQHLYSQHNK